MPQLHLDGWSTWVLVASIGLAGGWLFLLWLVSLPGRQRPLRAQPANADLGPEPPAVAGMLAHGGRVGDEVAAATLLDLAARHVIDLEQVSPQLCLCRVRQWVTRSSRRMSGASSATWTRWPPTAWYPHRRWPKGWTGPPGGGGNCAVRSSPTQGPAACRGRGGARGRSPRSACPPRCRARA